MVKDHLEEGKNCKIGNNFTYKGKLILGDNVIIKNDVNFNCESVIIGNDCEIGNEVNLQGGSFIIGNKTRIRHFTRMKVTKSFEIGPDSKIGCYWNITGREIKIGGHLWCVDGDFFGNGIIGGGSCYDVHSMLKIGNHCHLGLNTYINTARPVIIGDNVGFGFRSMIFTHGAWQNLLEGYPVKFAPVNIGDNAWIPTNILIMPGVTVGEGATIGSGSVVTRDVPAYSLAVGVPARVLKGPSEWPKKLTINDKNGIMHDIIDTWKPFIKDSGFEITTFNETRESIEISFDGMENTYNLVYFANSENIPDFNEKENTIVLTFDENYFSDKVDMIFYLKSYSFYKKRDNPVSDHIQNFLRRRGIKFFKEKRIN